MMKLELIYRIIKSKMPFAKNHHRFLEHVLRFCRDNKVSVRFENEEYVMDDGDSCENSGYFGELWHGARKYVLVVAVKKEYKHWLGIFVHEFCHLEQLKEGCPTHKALSNVTYKGGNAVDVFFLWLEGKRIPKDKVNSAWKLVRNMELDNEYRTVEMIKKWNLPISIKEYIKQANTYIYFYRYSFKHRNWTKKRKPYQVKKIVDLMPDHFLDAKDYDVMPEKYEEYITKYCL